MTKLGQLDLEAAAKLAAGNWRDFKCFVWFKASELPDADKWAIIYTHNRDSGLLDQSNAAVIEEAMKPFTEGKTPDVVFESHIHWAVGHVDGFSIRVFHRGRITIAFKTYHKFAVRMDDYPILDDDDYSRREHEATLENITDSAWRLKHQFLLPDGWEFDVYGWLADNNDRAVENYDDRGGYPSEEDLNAAFEGLGFKRAA